MPAAISQNAADRGRRFPPDSAQLPAMALRTGATSTARGPARRRRAAPLASLAVGLAAAAAVRALSVTFAAGPSLRVGVRRAAVGAGQRTASFDVGADLTDGELRARARAPIALGGWGAEQATGGVPTQDCACPSACVGSPKHSLCAKGA